MHAGSPLDERAREWRHLPRGTEEERAAAEAFYDAQVLPFWLTDAVEREHAHLSRRYTGLILAVGPEPAPALLSLAALRPERVHLIYDAQREPAMERLIALLERPALAPAALPLQHEARAERVVAAPLSVPTPFERTRTEDEPLLQAYAAVRDVHRAWGAPTAMAVDISGGPPALSAGLAMAAYAVGADLVAVEAGELWSELGLPRPGSEHLTFPAQPYAAFGDLAFEEARRAFVHQDYGLANALFTLLADTVDARRFEPHRHLSDAYQAWDAFDLARARQALAATVGALEHDAQHPLARRLPLLREQAAALQRLATLPWDMREPAPAEAAGRDLLILAQRDLVADLAFTLQAAAWRRGHAGHYNEGVLLQYRLLELLVQRRLALRGLDSQAPDYSLLALPDLGQSLAAARAARLEEPATAELPHHLGLSSGLLLLDVLGDGLARAVDWPLLRRCLPARSRSILGHGFRRLGRQAWTDLGRLLEPLLSRFCHLEDLDQARLEAFHGFIRVPDA